MPSVYANQNKVDDKYQEIAESGVQSLDHAMTNDMSHPGWHLRTTDNASKKIHAALGRMVCAIITITLSNK